MAMNFDVLNQQLLPQIAPTGQERGQQQANVVSPTALAQVKLAIMKDQREAKQDDATLARTLQATELDLKKDDRDERKTVSSIDSETKLTKANLNKIDHEVHREWEKFKVHTDIAYKDYGLRDREQNFSEGLRNAKFGQEVKESEHGMGIKDKALDHTIGMDNKKQAFDVRKWEYEQQKKEEMGMLMSEAVGQGSTALLQAGARASAVLGNAGLFSVTNKYAADLHAGKVQLVGEEDKTNTGYMQRAATILMEGKTLSVPMQNSIMNLAGIAPEVQQQMTAEEQAQTSKALVLSNTSSFINNAVGDKGTTAMLAGQSTHPLDKSLQKERDDEVKALYQSHKTNKTLVNVIGAMEKLQMFNASPDEFEHLVSNVTGGIQLVTNELSKIGVSFDPAGGRNSIIDAIQQTRALYIQAGTELYQQNYGKNPPRAYLDMLQDQVKGENPDVLKFMKQEASQNSRKAVTLSAVAELNPNLSKGQLYEEVGKLERELSKLAQKKGKSLSEEEILRAANEYYNTQGGEEE